MERKKIILPLVGSVAIVGLVVAGFFLLKGSPELERKVNYCDGNYEETSHDYFTVSEGFITSYSDSGPKDVVIPCKINGETIVGIGGYNFPVFNDIDSVILPNTLKTIESGAFADNNLTEIHFGDELETIEGYDSTEYSGAFMNNMISTITFGENLKTIGSRAFFGNKLTSIEIPSSVTTIGVAAFNSNDLEDSQAFIYARNNDGSIDDTKIVSYGSSKVENIVLPSNVKTLSIMSFSSLGIKSITLNEGLEVIEGVYLFGCNSIGAFANNELTEITLPTTLKEIGTGAFFSNNIENIYGDKDIEIVGANVFGFESEGGNQGELNDEISSANFETSCR